MFLSVCVCVCTQEHGDARREAQQDPCDLGEGDPGTRKQRDGASKVQQQPAGQSHWTQSQSGESHDLIGWGYDLADVLAAAAFLCSLLPIMPSDRFQYASGVKVFVRTLTCSGSERYLSALSL